MSPRGLSGMDGAVERNCTAGEEDEERRDRKVLRNVEAGRIEGG